LLAARDESGELVGEIWRRTRDLGIGERFGRRHCEM
jgi:hypothetical protein